MTIIIEGPPRFPEGFINTTSRSRTWSRGLSPFFLGPVKLYGGFEAENVENAWQFSKVYKHHLKDGIPTDAYYKWALKGWKDTRAHRYPMGKRAKPEFSWWNGEALGYIEARKHIYIPLYAQAVVKTEAFARLLALYRETGSIKLWDFDGYNHVKLGKSLKEVVEDPNKKMGHAFVLAMMLERCLKKNG